MNGNRQKALEFYQKAIESQSKPNGQELRYQLLSSACMADPTMAIAFYELGNVNGDHFWREASAVAFRRALELPNGPDPGDMTPELRAICMNNLGFQLHHLGRHDEAREWVRKSVTLDPKLANGYLTLSMIDNVEGNMHRAVEYGRKAMELQKTPAIELGLALALMHAGKYAEGLKHFQSRVEYILRHYLDYPYPRWEGEPGKTLFLMPDQGIGDTLSFARFVPLAAQRCKFVHVRTQPELLRLLRVFFQRIPNISLEPVPCPYAPADYWASFMCLPTALGLTDEQFANAPGFDCPQFGSPGVAWKAPNRKLHIGVAWQGSFANQTNNWRSFPLAHLLGLYEVPDIQLYSLQVGENSKEIHQHGAAALIYDMNAHIRDVTDTLGILKHLDLVISCESLLPHVCALAKKECWIAYSYNAGDFRIGRTEEKGQLWNPYARIFKQGKDMDWHPVFERMKVELMKRVKS